MTAPDSTIYNDTSLGSSEAAHEDSLINISQRRTNENLTCKQQAPLSVKKETRRYNGKRWPVQLTPASNQSTADSSQVYLASLMASF